MNEKINYKGYEIEVCAYDEANDPREDYNMGKMLCKHGRYSLGNKIDFDFNRFGSWDSVEEYLRKEMDAILVLPLYLYDHSCISISTSHEYPFNDRWDAGQVGFIYATRKAILENYMVKKIGKKIIKRAIELLKAEVKEYDRYLTGDFSQYIISKDGEVIESCGMFDNEEECLKEAKDTVDHIEDKVEA